MDTETVGERKSFVLHHARGWYAAAPETDASCSALSWTVAKQKVLFEMEASQVQCMHWMYLRKLWNLHRTRVPSLHFVAFSITHSLTHWCFWDLFDVTLAENDAKSLLKCWCYCSWVDDSDSLTFFDSLTWRNRLVATWWLLLKRHLDDSLTATWFPWGYCLTIARKWLTTAWWQVIFGYSRAEFCFFFLSLVWTILCPLHSNVFVYFQSEKKMTFLDKGFSFSERLTTIDHITWCTTPCDKGVWGGREGG